MVETGKMRLALVTVGSTLATGAVIANAFYQKKQFYPSIVYLTKSNPSIAVLYAQVFVMVFLLGKAMRKIFFGQLRAAEIEHLIEKFWYVITETCLAFTVFRDDFSPRFVALFTFLLFMKAFHWLIEDRVDYMERSPIITFLFHIRVCSLLAILGTVDAILIHHAFRITLVSGASVQMVFGFEYAILLVMITAIIMKYVLHTIDYMSEHPWENKNVYLLYGELSTGFVKCCLYIAFVGVMVKIHTFPLFAIRPMYLTIRSFKKSLSDVILSRRAIAYMNTRFTDASEEELRQLDNTCIICREQMTVGKKLPCNHIFHAHCLRSWFQRQQSCPTCRMDVLSARAQQQQATPQRPQQPPQQPRMPPGAPFMGMPPPGLPPPGMPPPGMQPPGMPPPPPSSPLGTQSASPFSTPVSTSARPMNIPPPFPGPMAGNPFMMASSPFFTTPPPPFMNSPPPPIFNPPNINFSSLSLDELQAMEGQERENVEARVRVLRNVHSLLDTVIIQLNQYSQVITTLNAVQATTASTQSSTESTQSSAESTTVGSAQASSVSTATTSLTTVQINSSPVMSTTTASSNTHPSIFKIRHFENTSEGSPVTNGEQGPSKRELIPEESNTVEDINAENLELDTNQVLQNEIEINSPENELRRRRLEKFSTLKQKDENDSEIKNEGK